MNKIRLFTLSLAGLMLAASASLPAAAPAAVGKPVPDFTLTDIQGKTHTLSNFRGKVVVLAVDCVACGRVSVRARIVLCFSPWTRRLKPERA